MSKAGSGSGRSAGQSSGRSAGQSSGQSSGRSAGQSSGQSSAASRAEAPARRAAESFHARRRGAKDSRPPTAGPDPVPDFETVVLSESEPADSGYGRERLTQHRRRLQKDLEDAPLSGQMGLRLDYADNGVSRIHLPGETRNTEPGPLEGGVIGTLCVAAGHFAAASVAPTVGIRLVEFKVNILGVVQGDLLAIGEVVRKGRTLVSCRIEVVEDNDRVVAAGLATYLLQQA